MDISAGLECIADCSSGGIPDIITEETGILFEPENYEELAIKIKQALNKEITFNKDNIAEYAKENYSQDKFIGQLISIYETSIQTKQKRTK